MKLFIITYEGQPIAISKSETLPVMADRGGEANCGGLYRYSHYEVSYEKAREIFKDIFSYDLPSYMK